MTRRYIIAGTFAPRRAAQRIYGPLAEKIGAEVVTLPFLGLGHIDDAVTILRHRILPRVPWEPVELVELVGHSQGGLAALCLLRADSRVTKVVTLGAPCAGTILAPTWAPFAAARCMAPNSRFVQNLRIPRYQLHRVHSVVSTGDRLVLPTRAGLLAGAHHYTLDGVGHGALARHPQAISLVADILGCDTTENMDDDGSRLAAV